MVLALVVGVLCVWGRLSDANPEAKRLYDDLLSNYNRLIRPVGNNSDRLTVKMGLRLSQLIDVAQVKGSGEYDMTQFRKRAPSECAPNGILYGNLLRTLSDGLAKLKEEDS
ncbi:hypothetical protein SFRURICE_018907 [Spodoptera frugiperda]|nr:hypothetical protein SFRURICE_018907 [Spodoptera frugiperda]